MKASCAKGLMMRASCVKGLLMAESFFSPLGSSDESSLHQDRVLLATRASCVKAGSSDQPDLLLMSRTNKIFSHQAFTYKETHSHPSNNEICDDFLGQGGSLHLL